MDHDPRTERHGCCERSAARSGLSYFSGLKRHRGTFVFCSEKGVAQARVSLELMMKRQLELRREETRAIHE
jgi:hypothetical protein